jgi:hypothetical protein
MFAPCFVEIQMYPFLLDIWYCCKCHILSGEDTTHDMAKVSFLVQMKVMNKNTISNTFHHQQLLPWADTLNQIPRWNLLATQL